MIRYVCMHIKQVTLRYYKATRFRVKHCACGHSVATLPNPRGAITVSQEYRLIVARQATVVVAVPSIVPLTVPLIIK
jgi:hypothetical protein